MVTWTSHFASTVDGPDDTYQTLCGIRWGPREEFKTAYEALPTDHVWLADFSGFLIYSPISPCDACLKSEEFRERLLQHELAR